MPLLSKVMAKIPIEVKGKIQNLNETKSPVSYRYYFVSYNTFTESFGPSHIN